MIEAEVSRAYFELMDTLDGAPDRIALEIEADSQNTIAPLWSQGLFQRAQSKAQLKTIVQGARVDVGYARMTFRAATSQVPLSGGLVPADRWHGYEFGASPKYINVTRLGRVRRQLANVQFFPRNAKGKVAYSVIKTVGPRAVAVWVDAVVRGICNGNRDMETS